MYFNGPVIQLTLIYLHTLYFIPRPQPDDIKESPLQRKKEEEQEEYRKKEHVILYPNHAQTRFSPLSFLLFFSTIKLKLSRNVFLTFLYNREILS